MIPSVAKKNADKTTVLKFTFDGQCIGLSDDSNFSKHLEVILVFGWLAIEKFVRCLRVRIVNGNVIQFGCGGCSFGPKTGSAVGFKTGMVQHRTDAPIQSLKGTFNFTIMLRSFTGSIFRDDTNSFFMNALNVFLFLLALSMHQCLI